jgi:alkanesulfonate monooxygenase SsuD/methylene tetrahydromethanopterin reductase-like flavin-dependent oxidoreductase (luciferase family)
VWVGAHSYTSLDYAAKMNFHVGQNIDVDDLVAEKFAYFRDAWKKQNHPTPMPRTLLARHVHVAETDEQARAEAEPQLLKGFFGDGAAREAISKTRIGWGGDARGTAGERSAEIDSRSRVFQETTKSYDFWIDNGLALIGSPETVVRLLQEQQAHVGYDIFLAQHGIGGMPTDQVDKSFELFGKEVIPAFA